MVKIKNDCVGCPPEMGCLGSSCPYREVPHYYCDECGYEEDTFYRFQNGWGEDTEKIYCHECAIEKITTEMIDAFFEEDDYYKSDEIKYFYYIVLSNKFDSDIITTEIINKIKDEDYKKVREDYAKNGDVKKGLKFLDDISVLSDFLEFIFEVDKV